MDLAPEITCPTLFLARYQEPSEMYPAEAFAAATKGSSGFGNIPDCDHFYTNRFEEVTRRVTGWLNATI